MHGPQKKHHYHQPSFRTGRSFSPFDSTGERVRKEELPPRYKDDCGLKVKPENPITTRSIDTASTAVDWTTAAAASPCHNSSTDHKGLDHRGAPSMTPWKSRSYYPWTATVGESSSSLWMERESSLLKSREPGLARSFRRSRRRGELPSHASRHNDGEGDRGCCYRHHPHDGGDLACMHCYCSHSSTFSQFFSRPRGDDVARCPGTRQWKRCQNQQVHRHQDGDGRHLIGISLRRHASLRRIEEQSVCKMSEQQPHHHQQQQSDEQQYYGDDDDDDDDDNLTMMSVSMTSSAEPESSPAFPPHHHNSCSAFHGTSPFFLDESISSSNVSMMLGSSTNGESTTNNLMLGQPSLTKFDEGSGTFAFGDYPKRYESMSTACSSFFQFNGESNGSIDMMMAVSSFEATPPPLMEGPHKWGRHHLPSIRTESKHYSAKEVSVCNPNSSFNTGDPEGAIHQPDHGEGGAEGGPSVVLSRDVQSNNPSKNNHNTNSSPRWNTRETDTVGVVSQQTPNINSPPIALTAEPGDWCTQVLAEGENQKQQQQEQRVPAAIIQQEDEDTRYVAPVDYHVTKSLPVFKQPACSTLTMHGGGAPSSSSRYFNVHVPRTVLIPMYSTATNGGGEDSEATAKRTAGSCTPSSEIDGNQGYPGNNNHPKDSCIPKGTAAPVPYGYRIYTYFEVFSVDPSSGVYLHHPATKNTSCHNVLQNHNPISNVRRTSSRNLVNGIELTNHDSSRSKIEQLLDCYLGNFVPPLELPAPLLLDYNSNIHVTKEDFPNVMSSVYKEEAHLLGKSAAVLHDKLSVDLSVKCSFNNNSVILNLTGVSNAD